MKQQLHRSLTFWSGLLVMLSIGWAWRDSQANELRISAGRWGTTHQSSAVVIDHNPTMTPDWRAEYSLGHSSLFGEISFPAPFVIFPWNSPPFNAEFDPFAADNSYRDWHFYSIEAGAFVAFLPHWLILLAFGLQWTALLIWRGKRRSRNPPSPSLAVPES